MTERLCGSFPAKIVCENPKIPVGEVVTVKDNLHQFDEIGTISWKKSDAYTIDYLEVQWNNEEFDIDINDLEALDENDDTFEAIKYWNYWITEF
ncbi:calcium-binding protein [Methanobrevibacter filiformis]|uniref:Calcium binding protein n=1 Tax=Methanobrevibacter filiformis TaxID=55758 RepID=A0A166CDV7_9EURY|nr:calcium-binding protein [Methanobrevibacter filiformis]KZX13477.1 hypothetical protein MBFIL_09990 [Methanobrevibacter filiformis]